LPSLFFAANQHSSLATAAIAVSPEQSFIATVCNPALQFRDS
jgi:hypothetical protein